MVRTGSSFSEGRKLHSGCMHLKAEEQEKIMVHSVSSVHGGPKKSKVLSITVEEKSRTGDNVLAPPLRQCHSNAHLP